MLQYIEIILGGIAIVIGASNMLLIRKVFHRLQQIEIQQRQQSLAADAETEIDLSRRLIALQQARFSPMSRPIHKVKK